MFKTSSILSMAIAVLLTSGCASLGTSSRIGNNDGNDQCFNQLQKVDELAVYYKDDRIQEIMTGTLAGAAVGAAGGAGIAAAFGNDVGAGALIGSVAGAVSGGFSANAYWEKKLADAQNNKQAAINAVNSDMRAEISHLNKIDAAIDALYHCRTKQRDKIRRDFASGKLSRSQAQAEWQKWAELIDKDKTELAYLGEAIQNMKSIESAYQFASEAMVEGNDRPKKSKSSDKKKRVQSNTPSHKAATKVGNNKGLVSSVVEKVASVEKKTTMTAKMQQESLNPNGFEVINSALTLPLLALSLPETLEERTTCH